MVDKFQFERVLNAWTDDVRVEAMRLFLDGVAHDRATAIAISVVDAKDLARMRSAQALGMPAGVARALKTS